MAMQGMNTSPARDMSTNAPSMQSKIPLPAPHKTTVTAPNTGNGPTAGPAVKGLSGGVIAGKIKV